MDGGWALVVSAVVTAVGGLLATMLSRFRKENKQDHDVVLGLIKIVYNRLNRVDEKIDSHVEWHGKK
jgi:hypothetical protein